MTPYDAPPRPPVLVGIDGSRAAVHAARWAAEEASARAAPLHLVHVLAPNGSADDVQRAELALFHARNAVTTSFGSVPSRAVDVREDLLRGRPTTALLNATRSAALICVGAVGLRHAVGGRLGSTAATLAAAAHCSTAIVRARDGGSTGVVLAEVDETPSSAEILDQGLAQARLRRTSLRVLTTWQPSLVDQCDRRAAFEAERLAWGRLDRRLECWRHRHPELDVHAVAARGTVLDYLAHRGGEVGLVVVGRDRPCGLADVVGPHAEKVLRGAQCSVLVCAPHGRL